MRKPFYWKERSAWYLRVEKPGGGLKTIRLAENRSDAYEVWARIRDARAAEQAGRPPVGGLVQAYIDDMRKRVTLGQLSEKSVPRRVDHLKSFVASVGAGVSVGAIRPADASRWLDGQAWGATTRHHAVADVRRALDWARKQGLCESNPLAEMSAPKGEGRDFIVTPDVFERLRRGYQIPRKGTQAFLTILNVLRLTGCRPGEPIAVRVEHWDARRRRWVMPEHKTKRKTKKPRVVYLSPCAETITRIAAQGRSKGPLFRPDKGREWKYSEIRVRFERLRKKVGVPGECVLYSFRHTYITDALLSGVDVATVAQLAGTSIQMIQSHYGHLAQHHDHLSDAADRAHASRYAARNSP